MDTRVCTGFALAASYWREEETDEISRSPEYEQEQAAVRAALVARCSGPRHLPQRQRR